MDRLAPLAAFLLPSGGVWAADAVTGGGIDYAGLAALVTAISGLVATLGAIYLGSRKKSNDSTEQALKVLLELQAKKLQEPPEEDPKP